MSYESLSAERDGAVGIVTLNRPERRNALPEAGFDEFAEALGFAHQLASGPTMAIRLTKQAVYQSLTTDLPGVLELEEANQAICLHSEDGREGPRAFREKRVPVFTGR